MRRKTVITRPATEAQAMCASLARHGLKSKAYPLLLIDFSPHISSLLANGCGLENYDAVIFVSPNAVQAFSSYFPAWPPDVLIGVVGSGSRSRLAEHGVSEPTVKIICPDSHEEMDSVSLLAKLLPKLNNNSRILIIRAQTGRNYLVDNLKQNGHQVDCFTAYRRHVPPMTTPKKYVLKRLIRSSNAWYITSIQSLANLIKEVSQLSKLYLRLLQERKLFVGHQRIESQAILWGFQNVETIGFGNDALINRLLLDVS